MADGKGMHGRPMPPPEPMQRQCTNKDKARPEKRGQLPAGSLRLQLPGSPTPSLSPLRHTHSHNQGGRRKELAWSCRCGGDDPTHALPPRRRAVTQPSQLEAPPARVIAPSTINDPSFDQMAAKSVWIRHQIRVAPAALPLWFYEDEKERTGSALAACQALCGLTKRGRAPG
jgi:hypothetical protein